MVTLEVLRSRRAEIEAIAARHGAHHVRVFGSVARGEADERSDVDFLVQFETGRSLFDLVRLADDLEDLLEVRVDVGTQVKDRIRERVENEAVAL